MAKKSGLVAYRRRKKRKISTPSANPPIQQDFVEEIIPAFVAYAATRFISNVVNQIAQKRFSKGGKHIAVLSSGIAFAGAWTLIHRFPSTMKYHSPAVVGSAIAAIQTGIQAYMPKYGWMLADMSATSAGPSPTTSMNTAALPVPGLKEGSDEGADGDITDIGNYGTLSGGLLSISEAELDELDGL
jgi:hypothetical protein